MTRADDIAEGVEPLTVNDFPYYWLNFHCPLTSWKCYAGTCGHPVAPATESGRIPQECGE